MFSYTVMVIDLIDPVDFLYSGQHGQHSQQPCADRSAGKISVTPLANPKTLSDVNASRVPELGCGWKNLSNRWRPVTQVLLGFYLGHVCLLQAFFNCGELRQNTAKNTKIIEMSKLVQKRLGSTYGKYIAYISPSYIE